LHSQASFEENLPAPLRSYFDELLSQGVLRSVAERWIMGTVSFAASLGETAGDGLGSSILGSSIPWLEHLQRSVGRELRIGSPIRTQPGDRRIVALVGPTGVGKTTTVAKLAAGFRLEARRRVGLLTIDTFRIAAVQQLRAYADIMDLPMEVVEKPEQMRPALGRLGDVDLVLIDTAGRSPTSDARIEQLVEMLRSAQPDETHLVLSGTSSVASIEQTIDGFAPVRPTSAILTKLDETPHLAGVLSAIVATEKNSGIAISYTTDGQQVPDDIAIANASALLSRLLPPRMQLSQADAA
jgi:flagellar biosynthesis protein FlhF